MMSGKVNADFSVMVGNMLLFAKVVPFVDEVGRRRYSWYVAFALNLTDNVRTMVLESGECLRKKTARTNAFKSISKTVKTMSQVVETWNHAESTAKAMI